MFVDEKIGISCLDYYIPKQSLSILDFINNIDEKKIPNGFSAKDDYYSFLTSILQLNKIPIEVEKTSYEMVDDSLKSLFSEKKNIAEDIDFVIVAQESNWDSDILIGHELKYNYGMKRAIVLNVSGNYCANVDHAVYLSTRLLKNDQCTNNILIITSNKIKDINTRVYGSYAVYGDGAGYILINKEKTLLNLIDCIIESDGKIYNAEHNINNALVLCKLYCNCIKTIVDKNNITNDQLKNIVIQNANPLLTSQCVEAIGLNRNKIFTDNLGKYGHVNWVDYIINIKDIINKKELKKNDLLLVFSSGNYLSHISSILKVNDINY